jgi:hypothetical protein
MNQIENKLNIDQLLGGNIDKNDLIGANGIYYALVKFGNIPQEELTLLQIIKHSK